MRIKRPRRTIQQAEQEHPDLIKGQQWVNAKCSYWYVCEKHGNYFQCFSDHNAGRGCGACGRIKSINGKRAACRKTPGAVYTFTHKKTGEKDTGVLPTSYGLSNDFAFWYSSSEYLVGGSWRSAKFLRNQSQRYSIANPEKVKKLRLE